MPRPSPLPWSFALAFACALAFPARAQDDATRLVAAAEQRLAGPRAGGATALAVTWVVTSHKHPDFGHEGPASFTLTWTAPARDQLDLAGIPEEWRKTFGDVFGFWFWQELALAPAQAFLEALEERDVEPLVVKKGAPPRGSQLRGAHPLLGPARATFPTATLALEELELAKFEASLRYRSLRFGDVRVLEAREIRYKTVALGELRFRALRRVGAFRLPCRLELELGEELYRLEARDWRLSGVPATALPLDPADVASRLSSLDADWAGLEPAERVRQLFLLVDLDCDLAATAIARRLEDPLPEVRRAAATALGQLDRALVVPALLTALPKNAADQETYRAICWALGEIGDVRAIEPLSSTVHTDKAGWQGMAFRAEALGKIRDKAAIDALMGMLVGMHRWRVEVLGELIVAPLRTATGQDFKQDVAAWRKWWREHRETFEFPK